MKTTKQTAANNSFLKNTKRVFNHLVYKKALTVCNAEGEAAARAYVQQFVTSPLDTFFAAV